MPFDGKILKHVSFSKKKNSFRNSKSHRKKIESMIISVKEFVLKQQKKTKLINCESPEKFESTSTLVYELIWKQQKKQLSECESPEKVRKHVNFV